MAKQPNPPPLFVIPPFVNVQVFPKVSVTLNGVILSEPVSFKKSLATKEKWIAFTGATVAMSNVYMTGPAKSEPHEMQKAISPLDAGWWLMDGILR
jgi:hypothetical protein